MNESAHELEDIDGYGVLYVGNSDTVGPLAPKFTPLPLVTTKVTFL